MGVAGLGRSGVIVATLLVLAVAPFFMRRDPGPDEPSPRPALRVWEMPGCYAVEVDPWTPDTDSAIAGPPGSVLLLADSLDEWGRPQDTFRAEPRPDTLEGGSPYRWFVRADTLWLVWNRGSARGGLALRAGEERLVGRARVTDPGAGVDVQARVEALKVNCATGRAEPSRVGRR